MYVLMYVINNNNNNGGQMEVGSGLGHDERCTRLADVLVPNWDLGKPAAFDLTVASPLNQSILNEACVTAGSSARFPNKGSMPPTMLSAQS